MLEPKWQAPIDRLRKIIRRLNALLQAEVFDGQRLSLVRNFVNDLAHAYYDFSAVFEKSFNFYKRI